MIKDTQELKDIAYTAGSNCVMLCDPAVIRELYNTIMKQSIKIKQLESAIPLSFSVGLNQGREEKKTCNTQE